MLYMEDWMLYMEDWMLYMEDCVVDSPVHPQVFQGGEHDDIKPNLMLETPEVGPFFSLHQVLFFIFIIFFFFIIIFFFLLYFVIKPFLFSFSSTFFLYKAFSTQCSILHL